MRALALAALLTLLAAAPADAELALEPAGTFAQPTHVTAPPGDAERLFVVERAGTVRVVRAGAAPALFLDLTALVDAAGEGGLLSLAFPPDHAVSGLLYVYYTDRSPDHDIHVREYRVAADSIDRADPASGREVLHVPHPTNDNHVGGQLAFGPDGYLYVGVGDGGGGDDLPNNAQNPQLLLGKLLRIDPRGTAPGAHAIPPDNPGLGLPQIYALGLRNPWRFSFDRLGGALTIGDVGQGRWEEVDHLTPAQARGANFGWRLLEGLEPANPGPQGPGTLVAPIHVYEHVSGACSITGGVVVRDASVPSLHGRYVYADYCAGWLRSLAPDAPPEGRDDRPLGLAAEAPISFGEDGLCRVYVAGQGGELFRLVERGSGLAPGCPPSSTTPTPTPAPAPPPGPMGGPPALTISVRGTALQRLGAVLTRGLLARCRASEASRCVVRATMGAKAARALKLRPRRDRRTTRVTFARGSVVLKAAGERALRVRLSPAARRVLKKRRARFRVAVQLRAEAVGPAGTRSAGRATIVLQRR